MALPLIPIILAVASVASGLVQGISGVKNAQNQIDSYDEQAQARIDERARQAKRLMSQQKTSFLKGGVYFSGTPEAIINETYDTSLKDINALAKDADTTKTNLRRQGTTAFYSSILEGVANGAMSFLGTSALTGKASGLVDNVVEKASGSKIGTAVSNWYNQKRGWSIGGFNGTDLTDTKIV